ncbi:MAG: hypothetical protein DHS80DRAFT_24668 [Piptocephalis tieghemiana]|nr:MAG: hypothetical protein DHS80DRAFT_24668 [Piptocephalis tieghemiana]
MTIPPIHLPHCSLTTLCLLLLTFISSSCSLSTTDLVSVPNFTTLPATSGPSPLLFHWVRLARTPHNLTLTTHLTSAVPLGALEGGGYAKISVLGVAFISQDFPRICEAMVAVACPLSEAMNVSAPITFTLHQSFPAPWPIPAAQANVSLLINAPSGGGILGGVTFSMLLSDPAFPVTLTSSISPSILLILLPLCLMAFATLISHCCHPRRDPSLYSLASGYLLLPAPSPYASRASYREKGIGEESEDQLERVSIRVTPGPVDVLILGQAITTSVSIPLPGAPLFWSEWGALFSWTAGYWPALLSFFPPSTSITDPGDPSSPLGLTGILHVLGIPPDQLLRVVCLAFLGILGVGTLLLSLLVGLGIFAFSSSSSRQSSYGAPSFLYGQDKAESVLQFTGGNIIRLLQVASYGLVTASIYHLSLPSTISSSSSSPAWLPAIVIILTLAPPILVGSSVAIEGRGRWMLLYGAYSSAYRPGQPLDFLLDWLHTLLSGTLSGFSGSSSVSPVALVFSLVMVETLYFVILAIRRGRVGKGGNIAALLFSFLRLLASLALAGLISPSATELIRLPAAWFIMGVQMTSLGLMCAYGLVRLLRALVPQPDKAEELWERQDLALRRGGRGGEGEDGRGRGLQKKNLRNSYPSKVAGVQEHRLHTPTSTFRSMDLSYTPQSLEYEPKELGASASRRLPIPPELRASPSVQ